MTVNDTVKQTAACFGLEKNNAGFIADRRITVSPRKTSARRKSPRDTPRYVSTESLPSRGLTPSKSAILVAP